jgi:hypothetical protein
MLSWHKLLYGLAHNSLRLATGLLSGGWVIVYRLYTHWQFEMAAGPGLDGVVNHKQHVNQRV